ncbi:MAG: DNA replication/repair protein RecF [Rhodospirillaceae bacterium]|nr:MAG: DNA replication/repair protein RecF [Rhodospirillaceae bacterium]
MQAGVGVTRLTLTAFRSYSRLRLDLDQRPVVLTGANGAGKTNLLEALSFLAPGRGLRSARLATVGQTAFGPALVDQSAKPDLRVPQPWAVAATLATNQGPVELASGLDPAKPEKRLVRIDGMPAKGAAALGRQLGVIWLTPAMDRLFLDSPAGRRRFLDRLVMTFDPDHAGRAAAYDRATRQRARLLRDRASDPIWYDALEDTMARYGVAMAAARRDLVNRLNTELARAAGSFPVASLALIGVVDRWLTEMPAVDVEDALRAALRDERRLTPGDVAAAGPHRSDLAATMVAPGHPSHGQAAALCSTGEQKALLISILLATARLQKAKRNHAPLLLLDEVAAHLDAERRAALFAEIRDLGAQAWMTGTDAALFDGFGGDAQFFTVDNARLTLCPSS